MSKDATDRISNKLISMMSVFNIVYDMKDLEHISFSRVLDEYRLISMRNVEVGVVDPSINYPLEIMTSCLLVIDSYIEAFVGNNSSIRAKVEAPLKGVLSVSLQPINQGIDKPDTADVDFVRLLSQSLDGELQIDDEGLNAVLRFTRSE